MTARKTSNGSFGMPKWFVFFVSGVAGVLLPWSAWVSHTLIRIDERSSFYHDSVNSTGQAITNLERKLQEHMADPAPHPSAMRDLQRQIDATNQRIERVEKALVKQ